MKYTVVIPARYASERLPGKPLLDIQGLPMIQRVYQQAKKSKAENVIVATDHADIERNVKSWGGSVCMTRADHLSGTDRLAEVVDTLGLDENAVVVNVQGDEPLIPPAVIDQVANNIHLHTRASVATVSERIHDITAYKSPNVVKVVSDKTGMALYFSRAAIPFHRDSASDDNREATNHFLNTSQCVQKHIGIYAYRVSLLKAFVEWSPTQLEQIEKLEQIRVLESGHRIHVAPCCEPVPGGVDTLEDLELVRAMLA